VNAGEGGNTPLHGAAMFGFTDMVRWLLDHDANPYATDYEGKTPLERAQANGHTSVVALLEPFFEETDGA
jgi:ankyrin repeat protein